MLILKCFRRDFSEGFETKPTSNPTSCCLLCAHTSIYPDVASELNKSPNSPSLLQCAWAAVKVIQDFLLKDDPVFFAIH